MTPSPSQAASRLVDAIALLEAERDALLADNRQLREHEADMIRRAYRRGYLAGRAASRRGAPAVTNPERNARGWVRETLSQGAD